MDAFAAIDGVGEEEEDGLALVSQVSGAIYKKYDKDGPPAGSKLWLNEKLAEADAVVTTLAHIHDSVQNLPEDADEARTELALAKIGDIYGLQKPDGFSHEKFKAAYLIGRGLTQAEVATATGVALPVIYSMMDKQFEAVVRHWRQVTLDDYFSVIIRYVDTLIETIRDPGNAIKLLRELRGLIEIPEDRKRWEHEMDIREREAEAREREVDVFENQVGFAAMIPESIVVAEVEILDDVIDAEYEETVQNEDEPMPE